MKTKLFFLTLVVSFTSIINAQLLTGASPSAILNNSNYFIDASKFQGNLPNVGKLLGFPKTDLTQFQFDLTAQNAQLVARNFFDGVITYNSTSGSTVVGQGKTTNVSPGFYYFSNPTGRSITNGQWMKLGGTNYTTTETVTSNTIDGQPIYSMKGTFITNGSDTKTTISGLKTDISSIYKITIYNPTTKQYTNTVYSLTINDTDKSTAELVTGSPSISVVYPAGTYDYIIEYLK